MSACVIRRAGPGDLATVAWLRREWTREQQGEPGGPADRGFEQRFAAWFGRESPRRITWLAEAGRDRPGLRPAGVMNLAVFERMPRPGRPPSYWGYLANAFVLAAHRNQGLGGRLLAALLGYADEHGFARVVLSPSPRSVPFYARAGFGPAAELMVRPGPGAPGWPAAPGG